MSPDRPISGDRDGKSGPPFGAVGGGRRVAVIGGGIAGLVSAYRIAQRARAADIPLELTLFEASNRLGGHLHTVREDGFLIEGGPDCFVSQKPGGLLLAQDLGIEDRVVNTRPGGAKTYVVSGGTPHPLPDGVMLMVPTKFLPLATSTLLPPSAKARMALDLVLPRGGEGDETLGEFVRRRLGTEALELIAEPLVAGVHAGDPDRLSLRSTFPRFKAMEERDRSLIIAMVRARRQSASRSRRRSVEGGEDGVSGSSRKRASVFVTLEGGVQEFVDALTAELDHLAEVRILLDAQVSGVRADEFGWTVDQRQEDGGPLRGCTDVVVATPAHAAASIVSEASPSLSAKLSSIEAVSAATVSVGFRGTDLRRSLDGFGMVIPRREGRSVMGVTFSSEKFPGRAPEGYVLMRAFIGGVKGAHHLDLDDRQLVGTVLRELADLLGVSARPVLSRVFRWDRAMPQYNVGHMERVNAILEETADLPGLHVTGSSYRGIGIPDCVSDADRVAAAVVPELEVG